MDHLDHPTKSPTNHDQNTGLPLHRSKSVPDPFHGTTVPFSNDELEQNLFAGRLGGGQRFTITSTIPSSPDAAPDAYRDTTWSSLLSPTSFTDINLWKFAIIEGVGTALQTFLSGALGHGLVPTVSETSVGAVFPVALASLAQVFLISLFIYCAGPLTGAHFNPLITLATFCAKLSSLPRTLLYVVFQCIGGVVGAFLCRAALGVTAVELVVVPGCYIDTSVVTAGQAYVFETMIAFTQVFLAFGLGLDPRNSTSFGPSLAPLLIGISSALLIFCSGFARPGYLGACEFF